MSKKKVAIVGFGPGGVNSLLDALEAGHEVELFEIRSIFDRTNYVSFYGDNIPRIEKLYEDIIIWAKKNPSFKDNLIVQESIINKFYNNTFNLALGDYQTFMANALPMLKSKYSTQLRIHGPLPGADDDLQIRTISQDGLLILDKDPIQLKVDHIVCAEGARRKLAKTIGFRFEEQEMQLANPYWAKVVLLHTYAGEYPQLQLLAKSSERGYNYPKAPSIQPKRNKLVLQVPSWVMFTPNQEQQKIALKDWICHVTYNRHETKCQQETLKEGVIPLRPSDIELASNFLFKVEHTRVVENQFFCQLGSTVVELIGDARETASFMRSIGAHNAMMGAKAAIKYLGETACQSSIDEANELHAQNKDRFELSIRENEWEISAPLILPDHLSKWGALLKIFVHGWSVDGIKIIQNDCIQISGESELVVRDLILFLRFTLREHAAGFKEQFFQDLLRVSVNAHGLVIKRANDIIELLELHVNLKKERPGYTKVSTEEMQIGLNTLYCQFSLDQQIQKAVLYPEISAEDLFTYLIQTDNTKITETLKDKTGKMIAAGLTSIKREGDYCSLYEVVAYHFNNLAFFDDLKTLNTKHQVKSLREISQLRIFSPPPLAETTKIAFTHGSTLS